MMSLHDDSPSRRGTSRHGLQPRRDLRSRARAAITRCRGKAGAGVICIPSVEDVESVVANVVIDGVLFCPELETVQVLACLRSLSARAAHPLLGRMSLPRARGRNRTGLRHGPGGGTAGHGWSSSGLSVGDRERWR
jgi:hypothetical protein